MTASSTPAPVLAYDRDGIQVWWGDCRDVLPTLDAVDHVITDPPYEAEAHTKGRRVARPNATTEVLDKWAWKGPHGTLRYEHLTFDAITEDVRRVVACQIGRLTRRWVLVFSQAESAHVWRGALEDGGLTHRRWCVWVKPGAQPQFSGDRPGVGYETIVTAHAPGRSTWNGGGKVGVFEYISARGGLHETEKPLPLMVELVSLFTDPGDLILDPFCGSGTTLVAAKQLGRRAIGIELERKWVDATIKRLEGTTPPLPGMQPERGEQAEMVYP